MNRHDVFYPMSQTTTSHWEWLIWLKLLLKLGLINDQERRHFGLELHFIRFWRC
jgi:hypothetical protein